MKILGVDSSLTATGVAVIVDGRFVGSDVIRIGRKPPRTAEARVQRLGDVVAAIVNWTLRADLVALEGLAFDGYDTERQLAGLSWLLRHRLWSLGLRVAVVPPSSVRTFAGVSARAPKRDMLAKTAARFGIEVEDDNAADALWLAEIGAGHLGCPILSDSSVRMSLLRGVTWPTSDLAA